MSAAEAGQTGGVGPDLPVVRGRLRVAAPAPDLDREDGPESLPGSGTQAGPGADAGRPWLAAAEFRSTELRVREVRVVRGAAAVQRRVGSSQAGAACYARTAAIPGAPGTPTVTRSRMAAQSRTVTRTRIVARTRTATQRSQRPGAIRLTRRGRRVVAGFAMLVVIVAVTVLWMTAAGSVQASSGRPAPASPYQGMTQVVVTPGQTLWSIAVAAEPSANPWAVMQQITEINALNGATIHAGQSLWVPRG